MFKFLARVMASLYIFGVYVDRWYIDTFFEK